MKYFFLLTVFSVFASNSYAQLKMAPTRLVIDGDVSSTHKLFVENTGQESVRVTIKTLYQSFETANDPSKKRLNENVEIHEDLSEFIRISPPIIARLKPHQRRTLRVRVMKLPDHYPDGEYRTLLQFEPKQIAQTTPQTTTDPQAMSMNLNFVIRTSIPIYATKGEAKTDVILSCEDNKVQIINNGLYQVKGKLVNDEMSLNTFLVRESSLEKEMDVTENTRLEVAGQEVARCI